jgi:Kef-type K+ transport system membrane component KefB
LTLGGLVAFLLIMVYGVQRLLCRFGVACRQQGQLSENALALLVVVVLAAAVITEHLGLHLAGVVMPKGKKFVRFVLDKFENPTVVVLLPLYFAFTGLRTSVRVISGAAMGFFGLIIIVVAIAGKLGGSMVAARSAGSGWPEAAGLGILMNAPGLMELVILNVDLDIGVISPSLYSMMVVMALVTTFMTTPLLERVYPLRLVQQEISQLSKDELNYQAAADPVAL